MKNTLIIIVFSILILVNIAGLFTSEKKARSENELNALIYKKAWLDCREYHCAGGDITYDKAMEQLTIDSIKTFKLIGR